jgi:Domain of unknown function (DUF1844)
MTEDEKPFTVSDRRHFTAEGSVREDAATAESPETKAEDGGGVLPDAPDFASFLVSLGAQAGAILEAARRKEEGGAEALPAARSIISILEMLGAKTEGNRTEEESRVLDSLLYELRMGYVEAARKGGA